MDQQTPEPPVQRMGPATDSARPMLPAQGTLNLSLVSHTNVGKTTLARTLLRQDIGEISDRPHVTADATAFELIQDGAGHRLLLWDTPGFGDSVRLARRLAQRDGPVGWFLAEVWDRWTDRAFWSSQQAIRAVRDHSDVVLYLVNAAEAPEALAYVDAEMQILGWIGKPVLVLLNQMGEPRGPVADAHDLRAWGARLQPYPWVSGLLPMDAFARCWVQEVALFDAIAQALPAARRPLFAALRTAWIGRHLQACDAAIEAIAEWLHHLGTDQEHFAAEGLGGTLRKLGQRLGMSGPDADSPESQAMAHLSARAAQRTQALADRLIRLHGLKGEALQEVLQRVDADLRIEAGVHEGSAAMLGGVVSGALAGLKADLATGGLSAGVGALTGAVLGGLAFAGAARGYNRMTGRDGVVVSWNEASLQRFAVDGLLLYLAVAHFGRGRGEWSRSEHPAHWRIRVQQQLGLSDAASGPDSGADSGRPADQTNRKTPGTAHAWPGHDRARLIPWVRTHLRAVLAGLYPGIALDGAAPASGGSTPASSARSPG